ncbi:unnamed protein product [Knipowitschia caucasica]
MFVESWSRWTSPSTLTL